MFKKHVIYVCLNTLHAYTAVSWITIDFTAVVVAVICVLFLMFSLCIYLHLYATPLCFVFFVLYFVHTRILHTVFVSASVVVSVAVIHLASIVVCCSPRIRFYPCFAVSFLYLNLCS